MTISGITLTFEQQLYEFYNETSPLLSILKNELALTNIYPNPATHKVNIKTNLYLSTIEVYNILGKKVYISTIPNKKESDISSLKSGVYYLKIQLKNLNGSIVRKIIKL